MREWSRSVVFPEARVLVLDDEERNVGLVTRLLHHEGYQNVRGSTDPVRTLEEFAAIDPDLVIVDAHMPRLDGFAFVQGIGRLVPPGTYLPVLMLTADASAETRLRALHLGASDFLTKPFDVIEAIYRIRNLLQTRLLHLQVQGERAVLEERVRERTQALELAHAGTLARLAQAAELRDDDTGQHTQRVAALGARLAEYLGLPTATVDLIRRAAPLHDVGKIGVPDAILLKPGPLTPDEWVIMKAHTTMGAQILAGGESEMLTAAELIARSHHERWDGSGYPQGLREEEIPLPARIVAVADFFDAVSHARPYRQAWPLDRILLAIAEGEGSHFDPQVVQAFQRAHHAGELPTAHPPGAAAEPASRARA